MARDKRSKPTYYTGCTLDLILSWSWHASRHHNLAADKTLPMDSFRAITYLLTISDDPVAFDHPRHQIHLFEKAKRFSQSIAPESNLPPDISIFQGCPGILHGLLSLLGRFRRIHACKNQASQIRFNSPFLGDRCGKEDSIRDLLEQPYQSFQSTTPYALLKITCRGRRFALLGYQADHSPRRHGIFVLFAGLVV